MQDAAFHTVKSSFLPSHSLPFGLLSNEKEKRKQNLAYALQNVSILFRMGRGVAGDTQALIQLKKQYCDRKDCLQCRIGYEYMKYRPQEKE